MVKTIHVTTETRDKLRLLKAQKKINTYEELLKKLVEETNNA